MLTLPTNNHLDPEDSTLRSRRAFLIDAARIAASGLLSFDLQLIEGCSGDRGIGNDHFEHLTGVEARTLSAFAAQILPAVNGAPGGDAVGAAHFIDRAFGMPLFVGLVAVVRAGLADLDARATTATGGRGFAAACDSEQIAIMRTVEATPFFLNTRTLVVIGTFADPSYGGNRDRAGWAMLGIEHHANFAAPFGWYDARLDLDAPPGAA